MKMASATALAMPVPVADLHAKCTPQQLEDIASRLAKLRDDVVAGVHPRLSVAKGKGKQAAAGPNHTRNPETTTNGVRQDGVISSHTSAPLPTVSSISQPLEDRQPVRNDIRNSQPTSQTVQSGLAAPGQSQFDPVLLAKSDVLVKAEIQQKRKRLEAALEEQVQQKKTMVKQKTFEQDALPEFDVTEVLRKSQARVPPFPLHQGRIRSGASADSFDENTFYSSQMNDSTTSDEAAEHRRPQDIARICKYFMKGKVCPYGSNCRYLHEETQRLKAQVDSTAINNQHFRDPVENRLPQPQAENQNLLAGAKPHVAVSQQERIALLEAELRALKEGRQPLHVANGVKDNQESQEDSAYSPPGPDEFGRDVSLRDTANQENSPPLLSSNQHSAQAEPMMGGSRRSPYDDGRYLFTSNHKPSPVAPQHTRVSPFAVPANVGHDLPYGAQGQSNPATQFLEGPDAVTSQTSRSNKALKRKRGKGQDPEHGGRKFARREGMSPDVRIKEEPESPPPLQPARIRRMPLAPEYRVSDTASTLGATSRSTIQGPQRPARYHGTDDIVQYSPPLQRVSSRNQSRYLEHEPDLRRVVSERHLRLPVSSNLRYDDEPAFEPRFPRAVSQVYIAPQEQAQRVGERHMSARPSNNTYSPSRPQLLTPRVTQAPPIPHQPVVMAPPPRRVYVDQYGDRVVEAERHPSVVAQNRLADVYQEGTPYHTNVRQAGYDQTQLDYRQHDAGQSDLATPRYREASRQFAMEEPEYDYAYDPRQPAQALYREALDQVYEESRPLRQEGRVRLQSVRPATYQYEATPAVNPTPRISGPRPIQQLGQPRVIQLSGGEQVHETGVRYAEEERPLSRAYHYGGSAAAPPRYATEVPDDVIYYEQTPRIVRGM